MDYKVYLTSSAKAKKLKKTDSSCIVVIEPEDMEKADIGKLRENGYTVLAYLSIGSVSSERSYYSAFKNYLLGSVENWDKERYIDLRRTKVRDLLVTRAKLIKTLGVDGFWLDNIDILDEYNTGVMYQAILSTIKRIKGVGGYIMLNGGQEFLTQCFDKEIASNVYKVQAGAFSNYGNACDKLLAVKKYFKDAFCTYNESKELHTIQVGAYSDFKNAVTRYYEAKALGFDCIIKTANISDTPISYYIDGVTQEEVLTRITDYSGKGKFASQRTKQSDEYKNHMLRVKAHGIDTFLLEYSSSVSKIKTWCKEHKMTGYYCSSDVNL